MKKLYLIGFFVAVNAIVLANGRKGNAFDMDVLFHSKENPSDRWEATISIESPSGGSQTTEKTSKKIKVGGGGGEKMKTQRQLPLFPQGGNKNSQKTSSSPLAPLFFSSAWSKLTRGDEKGSDNLTSTSSLNFVRQNPLKGITDMIMYGSKKDRFQSRTGLLLFGAITALELFVATGLFVGITGATILGLMLVVKIMSFGGLLMIG